MNNTVIITGNNPCTTGNFCQYGCQLGGYRCRCPPGFTQDFYYNQCVGKWLHSTAWHPRLCFLILCHVLKPVKVTPVTAREVIRQSNQVEISRVGKPVKTWLHHCTHPREHFYVTRTCTADSYSLSWITLKCLYLHVDVNECHSSLTCGLAQCRNTLGAFYCTCQNGYVLNPDGRSCQGNCKPIKKSLQVKVFLGTSICS